MRKSLWLVVVLIAAFCLEIGLVAQTNGATPSAQQSPPAQAPAPPPQPAPKLPTAPPPNNPMPTPASQIPPWYMNLPKVWPENHRYHGIAQGVVYAPEEKVPREPAREYRKGLKALEKKDVKTAEEHFLRATQLYPRFSSAFNGLGYAYELDPDERDKKTGLNAAAKNAYRQALLLNPNNFNALVNLGYLLISEKQSAEAERLLRMAIAIQAQSPRAFAGLMLAETLQSHFGDVLVTAKRVPSGGEDKFPIIVYMRAIAWENKPDREKAIVDYRDFVKRSPTSEQANLALEALRRLQTSQP